MYDAHDLLKSSGRKTIKITFEDSPYEVLPNTTKFYRHDYFYVRLAFKAEVRPDLGIIDSYYVTQDGYNWGWQATVNRSGTFESKWTFSDRPDELSKVEEIEQVKISTLLGREYVDGQWAFPRWKGHSQHPQKAQGISPVQPTKPMTDEVGLRADEGQWMLWNTVETE